MSKVNFANYFAEKRIDQSTDTSESFMLQTLQIKSTTTFIKIVTSVSNFR